MSTAERRGFRISVRALMILIALVALFTAPVVWMQRTIERQRELAVREQIRARDAQARAVRMLELQAAQAVPSQPKTIPGAEAAIHGQSDLESNSEIERLRLENERLRRRVEALEETHKGNAEPSEKGPGGA